jgi:hypothetical protein
MPRLLGCATVVTNILLCAAREKGVAMKRFTTEGTNEQKGRELIPALRNREARTLSRRQALGLLGGSLAGFSLLSTGLAAPAKAASGTGIRGPSGYTIPQLRYVRNGNWFTFTLQWKCVFNPSDVNRKFGTNWVLKEEDSTSYDDWVDATVSPHQHSAGSATKIFIPSQFKPSNPQEISFKASNIWHVDDLDTELGNEEIFGVAQLSEQIANSPEIRVNSNVLSLSP